MVPPRIPVTGPAAISAAAQKIRAMLEKDKMQEGKATVKKWAEGKKRLEALFDDNKFIHEKSEDFIKWMREESQHCISHTTVPLMIHLLYLVLGHMHAKLIRPTVNIDTDTITSGPKGKESVSGSNDDSNSLDEAWKVISVLVDGLLNTITSEEVGVHAKVIHTERWIKLLGNVYQDSLALRSDSQEIENSISDVFAIVASDRKNEDGKKLMVKDTILGFKKLGALMYQAKSSGAVVSLLTTIVNLVPETVQARKDALEQVIKKQDWMQSMTQNALLSLGKMGPRFLQEHMLACVNVLAKDTTFPRSQCFQLLSMSIDDEDQMTGSKVKEYAARGRALMYIDQWEMRCKLLSSDGEEEMSFTLMNIIRFTQQISAAGDSSFVFLYEKMEGAETMSVALSVKPDQGERLNTHVVNMLRVIHRDNGLNHTSTSDNDRTTQVIANAFYDVDLNDEDIQTSIAALASLEAGTPQSPPPTSSSAEKSETSTRSTDEQHVQTFSNPPSSAIVSSPGREVVGDTPNVIKQSRVEHEPDEAEATPTARVVETSIREQNDVEEDQPPPASQQLSLREENATTRSTKKFGRANKGQTKSPVSTNNTDVEEEASALPSSPVAKLQRSKKIELVKTPKPAEPVFKAPAPKKTLPTLGSVVKSGQNLTPPFNPSPAPIGHTTADEDFFSPSKKGNPPAVAKVSKSNNTSRAMRSEKTLPAETPTSQIPPKVAARFGKPQERSGSKKTAIAEIQQETRGTELDTLPWLNESTDPSPANVTKRSGARTTSARSGEARNAPLSLARASEPATLSHPHAPARVPINVSPSNSAYFHSSESESPIISDSNEQLGSNETASAVSEASPATMDLLPEVETRDVTQRPSLKEHASVDLVSNERDNQVATLSPAICTNETSSNVALPEALESLHNPSDSSSHLPPAEPQQDTKHSGLTDQSTKRREFGLALGKTSSRVDLPQALISLPPPSSSERRIRSAKGEGEAPAEIGAEVHAQSSLKTPVVGESHTSGTTTEQVKTSKRARLSVPSDIEAEDARPSKRSKRALSSDKAVVGNKKESRKNRKRSEELDEEGQGKPEKKQAHEREQKKARRSMSGEKQMTEEERAEAKFKGEVNLVVDQMTQFLKERCHQRLVMSSKQAKKTRSQLSKAALKLIEALHHKSVMAVRPINESHLATTQKYIQLKADIVAMMKSYDQLTRGLEKLIQAGHKGWAVEELLFE